MSKAASGISSLVEAQLHPLSCEYPVVSVLLLKKIILPHRITFLKIMSLSYSEITIDFFSPLPPASLPLHHPPTHLPACPEQMDNGRFRCLREASSLTPRMPFHVDLCTLRPLYVSICLPRWANAAPPREGHEGGAMCDSQPPTLTCHLFTLVFLAPGPIVSFSSMTSVEPSSF